MAASSTAHQEDTREERETNVQSNSWDETSQEYSYNLTENETMGTSATSTYQLHPFSDPNLVASWNTYSPQTQGFEYISDLLFTPVSEVDHSLQQVQDHPQWNHPPHLEPMAVSDISALSFGVPSMYQQGSIPAASDLTQDMFNLPDTNFISGNDLTFSTVASESAAHLSLSTSDNLPTQEFAIQSTLQEAHVSPTGTGEIPAIFLSIGSVKVVKQKSSKSKQRAQDGGTGVVSKMKPRRVIDSQHRACWRCKRYKKPCTGKGSICDTCITSGFRIWPSELGCRRGNLESFVDIIMPADAERILGNMNTTYTKAFSWRQGGRVFPSDTLIPIRAAQGDIWDRLMYKVQSTQVHGPGILELIQIGARHQRQKVKQDSIMTAAVNATSLTIDFYHTVVSTDKDQMFDPTTQFSELFKKLRKVSLNALDTFLRTSLTGRLKDWLPTFIGGIILVFSYILVVDSVAAIPAEFRALAWPNLQKNVVDLRRYLYRTAQDLLSVLAKGSKLLDMSCWAMIEETTLDSSDLNAQPVQPTFRRNEEGMRMMEQDEATFDAMVELRAWREQFELFLKEDAWMTTLPFTVDFLPIMSFSRMFQFHSRGEFVGL